MGALDRQQGNDHADPRLRRRCGARLVPPRLIGPGRLKVLPGALARVVANGQSVSVVLPTLPLATPVTAQLQASNGSCWNAAYPAAMRNDAAEFRAKSD
jgi:hypothetical protein